MLRSVAKQVAGAFRPMMRQTTHPYRMLGRPTEVRLFPRIPFELSFRPKVNQGP